MDRATWKRERVTVTPPGGWTPQPGARVRPDAELPAEWTPFAHLTWRLRVVRDLVARTLHRLTGRPAGEEK